jgi:hypothetical protein
MCLNPIQRCNENILRNCKRIEILLNHHPSIIQLRNVGILLYRAILQYEPSLWREETLCEFFACCSCSTVESEEKHEWKTWINSVITEMRLGIVVNYY